MINCPACGAESFENANFCSLCGEPLYSTSSDKRPFKDSGRIDRHRKILTDYQKLSGLEKRKIFWKISGLVLISAIILTILIDYLSHSNLIWSKYTGAILAVLFINVTLNTFLHNRLIPMAMLSYASLNLLLFLIDVFYDGTGWNLLSGAVALLVAYVTVFALIFLTHKARQKGLNVIAYSLIASGILCLCTEGVISLFTTASIVLEWSLIVFVSAIMISLLLLYIHYRLKKATDLKRFFHI